MSLVFYVISFSWYFKTNYQEPFVQQICLKKENPFGNQSLKVGVTEAFAFWTIELLFMWIFYGVSKLYFVKKSKDGKMPFKFGRYQRNIVTFFDMIVYNSFCTLNFFSVPSVYILQDFNFSKSSIRMFFLLYYLVLDIVTVLLTIILIFKLKKNIPSLIVNSTRIIPHSSEKFYVREPIIIPKRDVECLADNKHQYLSSNSTKPKPNNTLLFKAPPPRIRIIPPLSTPEI